MNNSRVLVLSLLLATSVVGNLVLAGYIFIDQSSNPPDRVGVLKRDLRVGTFGSSTAVFTLPKGLTVRDASPQGLAAIDLFEPFHFTIVVTSDYDDFVDYNAKPNNDFGEVYSLDGDELGNRSISSLPNQPLGE